MLIVNDLTKSYGTRVILDAVSFVVNQGDRVGLVGVNGCGKSTLLRIIAGEEPPDSGQVTVDSSARLGYLWQKLEMLPGRTIAGQVRSGIDGLEEARKAVERLAGQMAGAGDHDLDQAIAAYNAALTRFEALGGYRADHRVDTLLAHLGLASLDPQSPINLLSGGEQTRVQLASLLLAEPTLLLLDEPTNHLDIGALEWLGDYLAGYPGAVLVVSHDRAFLDRVVTQVLELDDLTHQVTAYTGNYSAYAGAKARGLDKQWGAWRDQQAEIKRVRRDIQRTRQQAQRAEHATQNDHYRRLAKKVAKKAKARERRLERTLEAGDLVEKPAQRWNLKLDFGEMPRGGQEVIVLEDVGHVYDGQDWLFRHADLMLTHGERIVLLGPNGSGKSTLLRIITGDLDPVEGRVRIGANVRLGYMPQGQETLDPDTTPLSLIRRAAPLSETDARNFLHFFLFPGDEVFVPIGSLSYGERARLLLATLVLEGSNCLVLDEPLNHLDIPSRERFEAALDAFPGTVLAAVHDRMFIDQFASGIWALHEGMLRRTIDRAEMNSSATETR
jgi:ATP-binding cassette subfamily F protein 3